MSSSVISAILNLKDGMSPKLIQCGKNWDNLSKAEKRAAQASFSTVSRWVNSVDKAINRTLKLGAAFTATATVAGLKTGFSMGFDLETYRSQLETATRDTERAGKVMSYAISLANKTPFEGGEMASAASALEMAQLKTESYLTTLGDTAAGTNKKLSEVQTQFIKAFSTGQYGEFLDSINVSRQTFKDFVRDNKLSTASIKDTQNALKSFLDAKFGGGMEKLARTTRGAWSTITGSVKLSLARIVGMGTDGTVRIGSLLDKVNGKAQSLASRLVEWSEDGTIDKISEKVGGAFETVWNIGEGTVGFFSENKWAGWSLVAVSGLVLVGRAFLKLISLIANTIKNIETLKTAFVGFGKSFGFGKAASAAAGASGAAAGAGGVGTALVPTSSTSVSLLPQVSQSLRTATLGTAGTNVGLASVGAAMSLGRISGKVISEGTEKRVNDFRAMLASSGKKERILTSPIGYPENYADNFRDNYGARKAKAEKMQNTINVTINGIQKSDSELADLVAKRIVEELENTW